MRKFFGILAMAGLVTFGAGAASAQGVNVRVGVGDQAPHHRVVRERYERPVRYERRYERRPQMRTVCRTVMRQHVRPNGMVVRRPAQECRQVVAGRRF